MAEGRVYKVSLDFHFQKEWTYPVEKNIYENQEREVKEISTRYFSIFLLLELFNNIDKYVKIKEIELK